MLLQSLVRHYELLRDSDNSVPSYGFDNGRISYALVIDGDGNLNHVVSLKHDEGQNKSSPQNMLIPQQVKRASGVSTNFLCDNSSYVLGYDVKGKPERTMQCFEAFQQLHVKILGECKNEAVTALLNYLQNWNPQNFMECGLFDSFLDDINKGANFVFRYQSTYLHEVDEVKKLWLEYLNQSDESYQSICLVTGEMSPISRLHPSLRGIYGGQSMGNSLISFNDKAYESYGNVDMQGYNSPVGEYATFAYSTVLNHLLSDRKSKVKIGDSTVVYWADSPKSDYVDTFSLLMDPDIQTNEEDGRQVNDIVINEISTAFNSSQIIVPLFLNMNQCPLPSTENIVLYTRNHEHFIVIINHTLNFPD